MQINSKPFGTIEVSPEQKIYFPEGLLGFEEMKSFYLLDSTEGLFYWLQSEQDPEIAFVLVQPHLLVANFDPKMGIADKDALKLQNDEDALVFAIVTIPEDVSKMSMNLQGPVIINKKTREARQIISLSESNKVKHFIMQEIQKSSFMVA